MFKTCRIGCNIADFSYATSKHHASNFPRVFLPKKILPSEMSKIWLFWPILKFLISRKLPCRNWKFAVNWYKNLRKSHLHQRVRSFFFWIIFLSQKSFFFICVQFFIFFNVSRKLPSQFFNTFSASAVTLKICHKKIYSFFEKSSFWPLYRF